MLSWRLRRLGYDTAKMTFAQQRFAARIEGLTDNEAIVRSAFATRHADIEKNRDFERWAESMTK